MTTYTVEGRFRRGRGETPFEREVEAESEDHARDVLAATLGSEHGISRARITVESVEEA